MQDDRLDPNELDSNEFEIHETSLFDTIHLSEERLKLLIRYIRNFLNVNDDIEDLNPKTCKVFIEISAKEIEDTDDTRDSL